MKQFLCRDGDGRIRLQPAFTLDEQMSLFTELIDRVQSLEASSTVLSDMVKQQIVDGGVELAHIRKRLEQSEAKTFELTECVIEIRSKLDDLAATAGENYDAIAASLDQLRGRLGALEGHYSLSNVYRLPPASGFGDVVSAENVLGVVSGLVSVTQRDRSAVDARLLELESRVIAAGSVDELRTNIVDVNARLVREITALSIRLESLVKKLSVPSDRPATTSVRGFEVSNH